MGSLMAGWDSPTLDPKSETLKRNRSLTKEEIDAYWKSKKEIEEEHLRDISSISENIIEGRKIEESDKSIHVEKLIKKNGWWTKSNWAFLNEPPVMEAAPNKYASQFHVADMASSKFKPKKWN